MKILFCSLVLVTVACSGQSLQSEELVLNIPTQSPPTPNADGVYIVENEATAEAIRNPSPTPTFTPVPATATPILPTPTPTPLRFEGRGDDLSAPFTLHEDLVTLVAQHRGSSNFVVQILSGSGASELSINTIGNYSGARAHQVTESGFLGLAPGVNRLEVNADGPWSIELQQPMWDGGKPPPFEWSGKGDEVIGPLLLRRGITAASFSHTGSSNFVVYLMNIDGTNSELLVNDIGNYRGTVAVNVQPGAFIGLTPGIYALVIEADGSWAAEFE